MPNPLLDLTVLDDESIAAARRRLHLMATVFERFPREVVQASAIVYKDELIRAAPKKTGKYSKTHAYRTFNNGGAWGARFYAADPLAIFIILGTSPHPIWAGNAPGDRPYGYGIGRSNWSGKKALYWPGASHPVTHVNHPGTKPNDYRNRAADAAIPRIKIIIGAWGRGMIDLSKF